MRLNLRKTSWQSGQFRGGMVSLETRQNPTAPAEVKLTKLALGNNPAELGAGLESWRAPLCSSRAATAGTQQPLFLFHSRVAPALVFPSDH